MKTVRRRNTNRRGQEDMVVRILRTLGEGTQRSEEYTVCQRSDVEFLCYHGLTTNLEKNYTVSLRFVFYLVK